MDIWIDGDRYHTLHDSHAKAYTRPAGLLTYPSCWVPHLSLIYMISRCPSLSRSASTITRSRAKTTSATSSRRASTRPCARRRRPRRAHARRISRSARWTRASTRRRCFRASRTRPSSWSSCNGMHLHRARALVCVACAWPGLSLWRLPVPQPTICVRRPSTLHLCTSSRSERKSNSSNGLWRPRDWRPRDWRRRPRFGYDCPLLDGHRMAACVCVVWCVFTPSV